MAIAIGILLLVVVTVLFHFLSPWWFTELAADWGSIDDTVNLTFLITGIVFVVLNGFLIWVIIRFRHRKGLKAHYEPESKKLEFWLTLITSVAIIALLAPGLLVWDRIITVPDDAEIVEVVGQQWHWSYRFPGEDGVLGQVEVSRMNVDNPFGMKEEDPAGHDDILVDSGELHVLVDKPYKFVLRSKDVLHNFTVPQFRVKMDLIPGTTSYVWLKPTLAGRYDILCEELCGIGHFAMRGAVVVDEQTTFDDWLDTYPTYSDVLAEPKADVAVGQSLYAVCSACHGAQGEGNVALNAPALAGQEQWYLKRQVKHFQQGLRGAEASDTYGAQMAPMALTLADDSAVNNVTAYIASLPATPSTPTISGDEDKGKKLFNTCKSCHGPQGQGIWALNAPGLKGINDWYLIRQLENYKQGIRGSHPKDLYGKQMTLLTGMLRTEQDMKDVVAYINTL